MGPKRMMIFPYLGCFLTSQLGVLPCKDRSDAPKMGRCGRFPKLASAISGAIQIPGTRDYI